MPTHLENYDNKDIGEHMYCTQFLSSFVSLVSFCLVYHVSLFVSHLRGAQFQVDKEIASVHDSTNQVCHLHAKVLYKQTKGAGFNSSFCSLAVQ